METIIISQLIQNLTQLLADGISPHTITYQFQHIADTLGKENLRIRHLDCKEYYDDEELSLILLMKNEALANAQFEQATKFKIIEQELLAGKAGASSTYLKIEASFFEQNNNCILFHFNKKRQNERLLANLIEGYNLLNHKFYHNKYTPAN